MQFRFPRLTPTVRNILIVMGVAFVATAVLQNVVGIPMFAWLALKVNFMDASTGAAMGGGAAPLWGLAWQPLTYWLMWPTEPRVLLSFGLCVLFTYLFLASFEERYGPKRVLQICLAGILSASIGSALVALVLPWPTYVYGGFPLVSAVIGAFPVLFADRKLHLIPFPWAIDPKAFVGLAVGLAALQAVLAQDPYVLISDVFALAGGYAFARWMSRPRGRPDMGLKGKKKKRRGGPDLKVLKGGMDDDEPPRWLN